MTIDTLLEYFTRYGQWILFLIVFLEYLNLPGLPAGIIMPAAGILISRSQMNFISALIVSVIAGLLGSIVLYYLGKFLGKPIIDKLQCKYPKMKKAVDKTYTYVNKYGDKGVLVARVIPVARTIISIVAGVFNINFFKYLIYSTIGITMWNLAFIYAGYAFGYLFIGR